MSAKEATVKPEQSTKAEQSSSQTSTFAQTHRKYGWTALFFFMLFGTIVEGMLGFKSSGITMDALRRELWSLAHFHGAMLAVVNIVYVQWADSSQIAENSRKSASRTLLIGSILMPVGFFLGGVAHPEGDPGIGIFLVPLGALLLLYTIGLHMLAAWKE